MSAFARLPHGYDTILGEEGGFLSGGERQRVTLARAYLQDAPSSSWTRPPPRPTRPPSATSTRPCPGSPPGGPSSSLAHRLSTIRDADQILVVDAGHITERGTHEELLGCRRPHAAMWRSQDLSEETEAAALTAQVEPLGAEVAGQEEE